VRDVTFGSKNMRLATKDCAHAVQYSNLHKPNLQAADTAHSMTVPIIDASSALTV
jgi:hypothetical protein